MARAKERREHTVTVVYSSIPGGGIEKPRQRDMGERWVSAAVGEIVSVAVGLCVSQSQVGVI